jgi:dihydroxyacetone kinase phosphoprotein-dependent L subunit
MKEALDKKALTAMLLGAVEKIRENHGRLSELDSYGGDGDHGTTMLRAMENLNTSIEGSGDANIEKLLGDAAWAVMGTDGGATGPLFGSLLMGMSGAVAGKETLDAATLAEMFEAGLASLQRQTKAQVGDKTVVDALAPAIEEARRAADEDTDIVTVLQRSATAAAEGARSTKELEPRLGRAKHAAKQSVGHEDPGAVSVSLIFEGFLKGVVEHGG